MGNMVDSLGFEEVNQTVTSTEYISGTYVYAAVSGTIPKLTATNASFTNMQTSNLQAGYFLTTGGSQCWVAFSPAYTAAPKVVVSGFSGTLDDVYVNAVAAGSVQIMSTTASKSGTYIALG